jgi:hypothetical protein
MPHAKKYHAAQNRHNEKLILAFRVQYVCVQLEQQAHSAGCGPVALTFHQNALKKTYSTRHHRLHAVSVPVDLSAKPLFAQTGVSTEQRGCPRCRATLNDHLAVCGADH